MRQGAFCDTIYLSVLTDNPTIIPFLTPRCYLELVNRFGARSRPWSHTRCTHACEAQEHRCEQAKQRK